MKVPDTALPMPIEKPTTDREKQRNADNFWRAIGKGVTWDIAAKLYLDPIKEA